MAVELTEAERVKLEQQGSVSRDGTTVAISVSGTSSTADQSVGTGGGRGSIGMPRAEPGDGIAVATGEGVQGTTATEEQQTAVKQTETAKNAPTLPDQVYANPLNKYTNYTYGVSLHAMSMQKYNSVVAKGQDYRTNDGSVLIASAGRRGENFKRNQYFHTDMYIDNLRMTTVIGHNSRSRGTNVIDINFTIVEPYGMTLIERLLKVCDDYKIKRWDQMIFMLQIDFFANDDSGNIVSTITDHIKYLPIKIIDIKIKVNTKGSEYRVTAIPASHVGLLESTATTPVIFEVLSKTVEEFFTSDGSENRSSDTQEQGRPVPFSADYSVPVAKGFRAAQNGEKPADARVEKIYSYVSAMNNYQRHLKEKGHQDHADEYRFVIEDENLRKSKIIHQAKNNSIANSQMNNAQSPGETPDPENELTRINAGSSVLDVINLIVRNSEYYTDLIKNSNEQNATVRDKPVTLHKVVSKVEFGAWDSKRNVYQKKITYVIRKYNYHNTKSPDVQKSLPSKWAKEYYYMYTGKNTEIIDFDIDFNTMFFTVLTADRERAGKNTVTYNSEGYSYYGAGPIEPDQDGIIAQNQYQYKPITQAGAARASTADGQVVQANDFYSSLMSSSRGDMINIKLKISGDPHLIKQDDSFFNPDSETIKGVFNRNNSLNSDAGEIFAYLSFRSPDDIDLNTGMYSFRDGISTFSGIYKMITVDNVFDRGSFTQSIDMVRLFDQPTDRVSGTRTAESSYSQRISTAADQGTVAARAAAQAVSTAEGSDETYVGQVIAAAAEQMAAPSMVAKITPTTESAPPTVSAVSGQVSTPTNEQLQITTNALTGRSAEPLKDPEVRRLAALLEKPSRTALVSDFKP